MAARLNWLLVAALLVLSCKGGTCTGASSGTAGKPGAGTSAGSGGSGSAGEVGSSSAKSSSGSSGTTSSLVLSLLQSSPIITARIPTTGAIASGFLSSTICPSGPETSTHPPVCTTELKWSMDTLTASSAGSAKLFIAGNVGVRANDIPVNVAAWECNPTYDLAVDGDGSVAGGTFLNLAAELDLSFDPGESNALTIAAVFTTPDVPTLLANHIFGEPPPISFPDDPCSEAMAGGMDWGNVNAMLSDEMASSLQGQLLKSAESRLCMKVGASCPSGSRADANGICRYGDNSCAPRPDILVRPF